MAWHWDKAPEPTTLDRGYLLSAKRARMVPYWSLAKKMRRYANILVKDYQLPASLGALRLTLEEPPPSASGTAIAWTTIEIHREWNVSASGKTTLEPGNLPGGWKLKVSWTLSLKRLDDYADREATGEECIRHELAHVLDAMPRAINAISYGGRFDAQDHATKVIRRWNAMRHDPLYGEHADGWKAWARRIGCHPTSNIDSYHFPLTADARRKYGLPEPTRELVEGFSLSHAAVLDGQTIVATTLDSLDSETLTAWEWKVPHSSRSIRIPLWDLGSEA